MAKELSEDDCNQVVAEAKKDQATREKGYRARALKMYPWVCGHCGKEYGSKNLHQLEVHHRDHNHDNNAPDGSNWELLCMYCHENQHARHGAAAAYSTESSAKKPGQPLTTFQPFAGLAHLLKKDSDPTE